MPASASPASRIGRFDLVRILGQGAQGTVHLARDTRLDRTVALKTLRLGGDGDGAGTRALLEEARLVSCLKHPHIVTLYDAGQEEGLPHLVFEFVEGHTLAAEIAAKGRLAPSRATAIARQVLQGIAYAHGRGIVHRDLKPANIMLDADGAARVMDFGIARHTGCVGDAGDAFFGTPSYLPPEYAARREFTERGDVFAAGMVLYEMLTGAPAVRGASVRETLHRMATEPFAPPSGAAPEVDVRLEAIVMRALAKDPAERWPSAQALDEALALWLDPGAAGAPAETGTLDFLLRRMRHGSDFPALSGTLTAVNRAVVSEREPASVLCAAILRDFALANKLLRVVNAAHFRQFGGGISTVSRAIAILGEEQVRSLALSLILIEHLQDRSQAGLLRDEVSAAYLSGLAARELAATAGIAGGEEAFLAAMFHRLGRLLAAFYLHDEAQAVDRLMVSRGIDAERASQEVLGLTYSRLGAGVARNWGFPDTLLRAMEPVAPGAVRPAAFGSEPLRVISALATGLVDVARENSPDAQRKALAALEARFGAATGLNGRGLRTALETSTRRLLREAPLLGLPGAKSPLMMAARAFAGMAEAPAAAPADEDTLFETTLAGESAEPPPPALERRAGLAAGVQEVTQALMGDAGLDDVLRMILETVYRAGGFKRVLLFARDRSGKALRLRLGFGDGAEEAIRAGLAIPCEGARDVFGLSLSKGADVALENLSDAHIRPHVPAWHAERLPALGMLLFPLIVRERPLALLYADADRPEPLRLTVEERDLLKTLRNQAGLAFKQAG